MVSCFTSLLIRFLFVASAVLPSTAASAVPDTLVTVGRGGGPMFFVALVGLF